MPLSNNILETNTDQVSVSTIVPDIGKEVTIIKPAKKRRTKKPDIKQTTVQLDSQLNDVINMNTTITDTLLNYDIKNIDDRFLLL